MITRISTLPDFLAQPAYQEVDVDTGKYVISDAQAAADATALEHNYLWRIDGKDRKIIAITALISEGTQERLGEYIADETNPEPLRGLAKKMRDTLNPDLLMKSEIYRINLGDEEVKAGFDLAVANGLLTAREQTDLEKAARYIEKPLSTVTEHDVKVLRYPATYQLCHHLEGQDWIVSNSRQDRFVFTVDAIEPVVSLTVKMKWREDDTQPWKTLAGTMQLSGGEGLYTVILPRPVGLSAARHCQFEYKAEHAQQVRSVTVSKGQ